MAIQQVADPLVGKKTEDLFANMGKTWDYLVSDPQLRWYVPLRMIILIVRNFFVERDPFSEIPGILSVFNFFLRNRLLANPLSPFSRAYRPIMQELELPALISTFNSLASDSFPTQDWPGKGCYPYRYWCD